MSDKLGEGNANLPSALISANSKPCSSLVIGGNVTVALSWPLTTYSWFNKIFYSQNSKEEIDESTAERWFREGGGTKAWMLCSAKLLHIASLHATHIKMMLYHSNLYLQSKVHC